MRKLTIAAFVAAATLTSFAHAGGAVTNVDASASVNVRGAVSKVHMPPEEFKHFKGYYKLSDGNFVRVFSQDNKYYAAYDNASKQEIVAVSANTFVGKNSDLKLVFQEVVDGREYDVIVASR